MNDSLGDRMKLYEGITRTVLPRRTNTMLRIDGKSFHTYTKNCKRPFDDDLIEDMNKTAIYLCENIMGAKLGYVQSDEITIWLTDYDGLTTEPFFGGQVQKITSVVASMAAAKFNQLRMIRLPLGSGIDNQPLAAFDCRVWTISELAEVANCFLWRCQDASRNSLQMYARSLYSHKELEGKNSQDMHDMIHEKGHNWNDLRPDYKRGRVITYGEVYKWQASGAKDHTFAYWNSLIQQFSPKNETIA